MTKINEKKLEHLLSAPFEHLEDDGFTDRVMDELPKPVSFWSQFLSALQMPMAWTAALLTVVFVVKSDKQLLPAILSVPQTVSLIPSALMTFPVAVVVAVSVGILFYSWATQDT